MSGKPTHYDFWLGYIFSSNTQEALALEAEFKRLERRISLLEAVVEAARDAGLAIKQYGCNEARSLDSHKFITIDVTKALPIYLALRALDAAQSP